MSQQVPDSMPTLEGFSEGVIEGDRDARDLKIGVVTARFNAKITSRLEAAALQALREMSCKEILMVRVPGAIEIPVAAKVLIDSGCDAIVALGTVIRGDTTHYEFVCNSVEHGCTSLQLETGRPIASGVLTTENEQQAIDRAGGIHGNKGAEAAVVAVEMARLIDKLTTTSRSRVSEAR